MKVIKRRSIYLVDDWENILSDTYKEESLKLNDIYALREKFKVTKLKYDINLGILWLEVKKYKSWLASKDNFFQRQ